VKHSRNHYTHVVVKTHNINKLKVEFIRLKTVPEWRIWSCPIKQQVIFYFNRLFIPVKYEMFKTNSQMERDNERKDHTMIFILIHSFTRTTSSPLHNNAKISTKSYKFTYTNTLKNQSWTLQDCLYPLCSTLPHKLHHPSAISEHYCYVWCKQYTQNEILQDYTIHNA